MFIIKLLIVLSRLAINLLPVLSSYSAVLSCDYHFLPGVSGMTAAGTSAKSVLGTGTSASEMTARISRSASERTSPATETSTSTSGTIPAAASQWNSSDALEEVLVIPCMHCIL